MDLPRIEEMLSLCRAGDLESVQEKVKRDASLAICSNYDGDSPLHEACFHGHLPLVKFLLAKGANLDARTHEGGTALSSACLGARVGIAALLIAHGAKLNPQCQLCSPLHEAATKGSVECCQLLISKGAKLEVSDCYHGTPLHGACIRGQIQTAKILLDAGANVNARKIHSTPLHFSAEYHPENFHLSQILLAYGADVLATDNAGRTPVDILHRKCNTELSANLSHIKRNIDLLSKFQTRNLSPHDLIELCRLRIRKQLGPTFPRGEQVPERLGRIDDIPGIPIVLKHYLNYSDLLPN
jgi:ankyrin repeat protein